MLNTAQQLFNSRKFVKHPESIPLTIEKIDPTSENDMCCSPTCHCMTFTYQSYLQQNEKINVQIEIDDLKFSGCARVLDCSKQGNKYEVSVEFLASCDEFQVKMALQVCQIKDFLLKKQGAQCDNETALKWINCNAAKF